MSPVQSAVVDVVIAAVVGAAVVASALMPVALDAGRSRRVARRVVDMLVTMAATIVLVGAAAAVVPGDPVARALGEDAPDSARAAMRETLGLHHGDVLPGALVPLAAGGRVLGGLVVGVVGAAGVVDVAAGIGGAGGRGLRSINGEPVMALVGPRLRASVTLGALAVGFGVVVGIGLGLLSSRRGRREGGGDDGDGSDDLGGAVMAGGAWAIVVGLSATPRVALGPALLAVVAVRWRWLPTTAVDDHDVAGLILPVLCLALPFAGVVARHVRVAAQEAFAEPFVRTARARGASSWQVAFRHVVPHALLPVVHLTGVQAGAVLSGAVVVERVFSWPGLGTLLIERLQRGDLPVVTAIVAVAVMLVVVMNLLADVIAALVDPRIRRGAP